MLQNAYFLAKIGADTAENEQHCAENLPHISTTNLVITRRVGMPARAGARATGEAAAAASGSPGPRLVSLDRLKFRGLQNFGRKILQIFGGLVLGCTKTKFCKKICVRQHFSSSTRCASFCTAAISKFSQKIGLKKQQFS